MYIVIILYNHILIYNHLTFMYVNSGYTIYVEMIRKASVIFKEYEIV